LSLYLKIILVIFGLAYLLSPVDIIPDLLLPYVGWIDDSIVIATLYYLIRYGKLPGFLFKKQGPFVGSSRANAADFSSNKKTKTNNTTDQKRNSFNTKTKDPYEILGISPTASKSQIQAAYKEAIKKYHPDKLSHLGKEFSDLANRKFLEIQKAYDILMKK